VNLPFLFFFYDAFNLNDSIYSTSFLYLGLNPYDPSHGATIIVGYPLLPYNLGMLGAYQVTAFDVLFTAIILKLLALAATYLSARILLRIAIREKIASWKAIYLTFLFNPFILFVNVIWLETDIFVILAILIGFYFIHYGWDRSNDVAALALGSTAILWAVFSYYSPILLIPAFVICCAPGRKRAVSLLTFVVLGIVFAIPLLVFQLSSFAILGVTAGGRTNPYSWIELFTPLGSNLSTTMSREILAVAVVAAVLIPALLSKRKVHLGVCVLAVFAVALIATPTLVQGDNFVLLAGLIPLALIFTKGVRITWTRILVLELFLVPVMWIVEMFNGPGQVTGLYYWSFFVFHDNVNLFQPLGGTLAWHLCIILSVLLLAATVSYLIWQNLSASKKNGEVPAIPAIPPRGHPEFTFHGRSPRRWIVGVAVVGMLVAIPVLGWLATPGGFSIETRGEFPSQLFMVHDFDAPSTYLQPSSNTFSISPATGTLDFGPASPSVAFERPLQNQVFDLEFSAHVLDPGAIQPGSPLVVANATGLETGFSTEVGIPAGLNPLAPVQGGGFTTGENPNGILANVTTAYQTNGTGVSVYPVSPSELPGMNVVFAGEMSGYATSQNVFWTISNDGTIVLESYMVGKSFYLGSFSNGSWTDLVVGTSVVPGSWFYSGFSVNPHDDSLTSWVNGFALTAKGAWNLSGNQFLNYGKFSPSSSKDGKFAFIGNLTGLYSIPVASTSYVSGGFVDSMRAPSGVLTLPGSSLEVEYSGSPPESTLSVDGHSFVVNSSQPQVEVGKIGDSLAGLQLAFQRVDLSSVDPSSGLPWVVLEFAVSIPLVPFVLYTARSDSLKGGPFRQKDFSNSSAVDRGVHRT
jgi:hypothetical protein